MRRSVLGAVALLLVLAGCGGDPKAEPSPAPSTSAISTTPSPTAPVMPAAASENTKAGAVAFVRYYIDTFNEAQRTGQVETLRALSASDCQACGAAIDGLVALYKAGGQIEGGRLKAGPATAVHNAVEEKWLVLMRVDSGPQSVRSTASAEPTRFPGGRRSMTFSVRREGNAWKVATWARS